MKRALSVAVMAIFVVAGFSLSGGQVSALETSGSLQGYGANKPIDNGTIVRLTDKDSTKVEPSRQENMQNMFGVTVDRQQVPIKLSDGKRANEVYVAVSGTYPVLVSTQNGVIEPGDFIALSALNGIGMKAGYAESTVFGRAVGSFDGQGSNIGTATIKDVDGRDNQTVKLGLVAVTIRVERNPNEKSTKAKVPELLERIGQAIAEKEVSPIRIYLSLLIAGISLIAAIVVIYSGVRNGIVSIGRNPMSKKSIFRALFEIILTSFLILIIGLFAVYLLLKL